MRKENDVTTPIIYPAIEKEFVFDLLGLHNKIYAVNGEGKVGVYDLNNPEDLKVYKIMKENIKLTNINYISDKIYIGDWHGVMHVLEEKQFD